MPADWTPQGGMQVRRIGQDLLCVWADPYDQAHPWVWQWLAIEAEMGEDFTEIAGGSAASLDEAKAAAEAALGGEEGGC